MHKENAFAVDIDAQDLIPQANCGSVQIAKHG